MVCADEDDTSSSAGDGSGATQSPSGVGGGERVGRGGRVREREGASEDAVLGARERDGGTKGSAVRYLCPCFSSFLTPIAKRARRTEAGRRTWLCGVRDDGSGALYVGKTGSGNKLYSGFLLRPRHDSGSTAQGDLTGKRGSRQCLMKVHGKPVAMQSGEY